MANITVSKRDWFGGINQLPDKSKVDFATEYALLVNGRVRDNTVTPVDGPADVTEGLPTNAAVQGIYGIGRFLLVFAGGLAFYRDYQTNDGVWYNVSGFAMSATAPKIWAEAIPASTVNFIRSATDGDNIKSPVRLNGVRNSSPQAIICMDGETQPWLIFQDGSARITQDFNQWTKDNAEYVPIAKYPFYYNGILYCIGRDLTGTFNQIYRSVTGRPCDFLIIVDVDGNKTGTETERGAPALAERVDFNEVTFIGPINAADGTFLVCTHENSYTVTPDYDDLIASEPTYRKQFLFSVGAVNDESVTDVLGDTTVIHSRGIRSFNGVQQYRFEGKYAPFNLRINRLIEDYIQSTSAAVTWENYAAYAVQTAHGYGILWYDMLLSQFVSLDLYRNQDPIIQFANVTVGTVNKLFARTSTGRILELFAGARQRCYVQLADLMTPAEDSDLLHSIDRVTAVFSYGSVTGHAEVAITADGRYAGAATASLPAQQIAADAGVIPVTGNLVLGDDNTNPLIFGVRNIANLSSRAGVGVSWNTDARLVQLSVETEVQGPRAKAQNNVSNTAPLKIIFLGADANLTSDSELVNTLIKRENPSYVIGAGSHTYLGTAGDINLRLAYHWNNLHSNGLFYAVPGPAELDTSSGEPFFQYVRQYPTRYSILHTGFADIFLFNSGFNTAGTQVEPDNLDGPTLAESTQALWLAREVAASAAPYQFVVMGTPPRSSAGVAAAQLDAINFTAVGANAVISGLGAYERIEDAKRVTFFNVGTGGNTLPSFGTPRSDSAVRISSYGYLRLTLTPLSALFEFVSAGGDVLDRRIL
jgi:hypothetical protein